MAQQSAVKRSESVPKSTAAPRLSRGPKLRRWDYAKFRQSINKAEDFADYLAGYPDASALLAYVYRLVPKIDMSLIAVKETYILKTADKAEMTPEFLGEKFGRGRYHLKLTDANREKGQNEVAKTWFIIDDAEKPPVYDIRTLLLGHADNIDEVNRQIAAGVLVRDASGAPRLRTAGDGAPAAFDAGANGYQSAPVGGPGDLFDRSTMGAVFLKLIDRGSQNPADAVKQSIDIAKMLRPDSPPAFDVEALVERVVSRLGGPRPGDSFDGALSGYERVSGLLDKIRPPVAANGAPLIAAPDAAAAWAPHLPAILSQARALIPEIVSAFQFMRTSTSSAGRAAAGPVEGAKTMTLEQRIEEVAQLGFQRMGEGISGFDFAAYIVNFHPGGREVFIFLDNSGGAVGLMALIAMNPTTRPLTADPARRAQIEAFLTDFFSFDASPVAAGESGELEAGAGAPVL